MFKFKVTANPKEGNKIDEAVVGHFEYNLGESLQEAIDLFGEKVVFAYFQRECAKTLQAYTRGKLEAGESEADVANALASYKLGVVNKATSSKKTKQALDTVSMLKESDEGQALLRRVLAGEDVTEEEINAALGI